MTVAVWPFLALMAIWVAAAAAVIVTALDVSGVSAPLENCSVRAPTVPVIARFVNEASLRRWC
ncbi:MAG: hypothetical protein R2910_10425 [Gemmatimonadales bacterium]